MPKRKVLVPGEIGQRFLGRVIANELCTCGHLATQHRIFNYDVEAEASLLLGQGPCTKCSCPGFTWKEFVWRD